MTTPTLSELLEDQAEFWRKEYDRTNLSRFPDEVLHLMLCQALHGEVDEMARAPGFFMHKTMEVDPEEARQSLAIEWVDCLKYLMCVAVHNGLDADTLATAFERKSLVVTCRAQYRKFQDENKGRPLLIVDLDGVLYGDDGVPRHEIIQPLRNLVSLYLGLVPTVIRHMRTFDDPWGEWQVYQQTIGTGLIGPVGHIPKPETEEWIHPDSVVVTSRWRDYGNNFVVSVPMHPGRQDVDSAMGALRIWLDKHYKDCKVIDT